MSATMPKRPGNDRQNWLNLVGRRLLFATQILCLGVVVGGCGGGPLEGDLVPANIKVQLNAKK